MGDVIALKQPRQQTIRGLARQAFGQTMRGVAKPIAVVIVALGRDGDFAVRAVNHIGEISDFDMYARAGAIVDREARQLLE